LKENTLVKKSILVVGMLCALCSAVVIAQDANQPAPALDPAQQAAIIKEFTRPVKMDGVILSFVLLNNKTVDVLFSGEGKYSMRAKANMATMFYVQGVPQKDITLDPKFEVEQDGKSFAGEAISMKNLKPGSVAKGTRIEGLIQLNQKINVSQPFAIKNNQNKLTEFKLSPEAVKLLEN
jgi:hypothetical protein